MTDHELPEPLKERAAIEAREYKREEVRTKIGVRRGEIPPHIASLLDLSTDADGRPVSYSWAKDPRWPDGLDGRKPHPHEVEILTLQALERIERLLMQLLIERETS